MKLTTYLLPDYRCSTQAILFDNLAKMVLSLFAADEHDFLVILTTYVSRVAEWNVKESGIRTHR